MRFALAGLCISLGAVANAAKEPATKPNLQAPAAQPPQRDRIEMTLINPAGTDAAHWHVRARATYNPASFDQPGATVTTRSYANCRQDSSKLPVPTIDILPCKGMATNTQWIDLNPAQVRRLGSRGLTLDFDRRMQVDGGDYIVSEMSVDIAGCDIGCPSLPQTLRIICREDDSTGEQANEIFTTQFALRFVQRAPAGGDRRTCTFQKGDYPGWHDRGIVMERIHSRFGWPDERVKHSLLSSFAVVPRRDGGWMPNRTFGWEDGPGLCDAPYDRVDAKQKLGPQLGWPSGSEAEIIVFRRKNGEVCSIWLDGDIRPNDPDARVRRFFEFARGKFVQLRTDEPDSVKRRLAFVDGQPYEYVYQPNIPYDSDKTIFYWHRDAAREWPERLTEAPDMQEFEAAAQAAAALLKEFGSRPTTRRL
jgi:hypothetical protein